MKPESSPHDTENLLREIDEQLQQERWLKLWQQHQKKIIGGLVALVLVVAGINAYVTHQHSARISAGETLEKILAEKTDKPEEMLEVLQAFSDQQNNQFAAHMARFHLAARQMGMGKADDAASTYKSLADAPTLPEEMKDLAAYRWLQISWQKDDFSEAEKVIQRLVDRHSALAPLAREIKAVRLHHDGKTAEAATIYQALAADDKASDQLRQRAAELARYLASQPTPASAP
ncbi:MAG: hypothetical protein EBZ69_02870 [Alphaproteobacteria bacterium]|nr:hypothetical protein [Alphaproteobacteria bacterium]